MKVSLRLSLFFGIASPITREVSQFVKAGISP